MVEYMQNGKAWDESTLVPTGKEFNRGKKVKQLSLDFESENKDELRDFIKDINPYEITPIEAINILDKIKNISSK